MPWGGAGVCGGAGRAGSSGLAVTIPAVSDAGRDPPTLAYESPRGRRPDPLPRTDAGPVVFAVVLSALVTPVAMYVALLSLSSKHAVAAKLLFPYAPWLGLAWNGRRRWLTLAWVAGAHVSAAAACFALFEML